MLPLSETVEQHAATKLLKVACGAVACLLLVSTPAFVSCERINSFAAAEITQHLANFRMAFLLFGFAAVVGVFGTLLYSIATFRSTRKLADGASRPRAVAEILWALVPIAIVIGAALPAIRAMTSESDRATPVESSLSAGYLCHMKNARTQDR